MKTRRDFLTDLLRGVAGAALSSIIQWMPSPAAKDAGVITPCEVVEDFSDIIYQITPEDTPLYYIAGSSNHHTWMLP